MNFLKNIILGLLILAVSQAKNPFKHVIVLMMENHSYDNMLGFNPAPIGSLNENTYCNIYNNTSYCTKKGAEYQTHPDPLHTFYNVQYQLYDTDEYPTGNQQAPNMAGFAYNYGEKDKGDPQNVFNGYSPEQVPVISALAQNFLNFDRWFCSVPSQTNPNKVFVHAATSGGNTANCGYWFCSGWPMQQTTIQDKLQAEGYSWEVHWHDWCEAMTIAPMRYEYDNFFYDQGFEKLYKKLEDGNLADYTYLVPRIHWDDIPDGTDSDDIPKYGPNTQHPSEDVRSGEWLMKEVYEKFRQSQYWEDTLLLVVYDEHGGFFDHEVPPSNVTNPTPNEDPQAPFEFNRLGIRVPSIAISPWLKNTVDSTQFEHASIPHTIHDIFNLTSDYLNARDAEANPFIRDDLILDEMRTDCPITLPDPPSYDEIPFKRSDPEELNGTPKTEAYYLGTLLVKEGILNLMKYKNIIDTISTDDQAMQFVKEAQIILGYRPIGKLEFKYLHKGMAVREFPE